MHVYRVTYNTSSLSKKMCKFNMFITAVCSSVFLIKCDILSLKPQTSRMPTLSVASTQGTEEFYLIFFSS